MSSESLPVKSSVAPLKSYNSPLPPAQNEMKQMLRVSQLPLVMRVCHCVLGLAIQTKLLSLVKLRLGRVAIYHTSLYK